MLSLRLKTLTNYIEQEDVVADIGSDHGYLPIYLAKNGHPFVYACENKKGPYDRLVKSVRESGYQEKITTSLSNGLSEIPTNVNTVVIAGMGGSLISEILVSGSAKLDNVQKLVLLPHNNEKELRKTLTFIGFTITNEEVISEDGKFYELIVAINRPCVVCGVETLFGPYNLREKTPTFIAKWQNIYEENAKLLANEKLSVNRRDELISEQVQIENAIKREEDDEY